MNLNSATDIIKLLRPKYYNTLTRILMVAGIALLSKPVWIDILNLGLHGWKLSIIGEFDWLLGLIIIILSLTYNLIHRYIDLKYEYNSTPAFELVNFKTFKEFGELCQEILPIIKDNEYIFLNTGPNSDSENLDTLRTDLTMWEKLKIDAIIPNNEAIKKLIKENKSLIPKTHEEIFNEMLLHIDAFREHVANPKFDYSEYQFPNEFPKILIEESLLFASRSKQLKKIQNWISNKFHKKNIANWFIFGSIIITPRNAHDVDLALYVSEDSDVYHFIDEIKFDFKIKFKLELHITIFFPKDYEEYKLFSSKNPIKIEKNGQKFTLVN
ncbi:MAG: hypothetical protein IR153_07530 [Flavobacterium sp.]|nr:hypothetical protein [Flavobacterium sp.]